MKKIAILGCENSHADAFLKSITTKEEFSDVEVVGVYSDDPKASQKLQEKYGVPILEHYTDALGKIDGLVITARHGAKHFPYAQPYLNSGIPMFIDKPITITEEEALTFMRQLRDGGVRISGGSSLKQDIFIRQLKKEAEEGFGGKTVGGYVRAPYQSKNAYGDFFFYAQHLVEMVLEVFGRFPLSVTAKQNGSQIHVLFRYADYDCVGLYCDKNSYYYASRMSEAAANGYVIHDSGSWFYEEFKEFYTLLSGGEQTCTYEEFISPVFVMNAIVRSLESGCEEPVGEIKI